MLRQTTVKKKNALRTSALLVFLLSYFLGIGSLCGITPSINLWVVCFIGAGALIYFFMSYFLG